MKARIVFTTALIVVHVLLGFLAHVLPSDRLGALFLGTVYVPLLPLDALGLPVFVRGAFLFPGVTPLGWGSVAITWVLIYFGVATVAARLVLRFRGA